MMQVRIAHGVFQGVDHRRNIVLVAHLQDVAGVAGVQLVAFQVLGLQLEAVEAPGDLVARIAGRARAVVVLDLDDGLYQLASMFASVAPRAMCRDSATALASKSKLRGDALLSTSTKSLVRHPPSE